MIIKVLKVTCGGHDFSDFSIVLFHSSIGLFVNHDLGRIIEVVSKYLSHFDDMLDACFTTC
ncbi:MAG: hypothetical protein OXE77_01495 [Flavobacteriaceae bacterium]|nr:hypothetical protein [Flavobacteriaceae bacterium]